MKRVFDLSPVADQIRSEGICCSDDDLSVMMHTVFVGESDTEKPLLIVLAGYGSSGIYMYSCFESLSKNFRLVLVDLIGMGLSSRPNDFNEVKTDVQRTIQYIVDYLERWRKTLGYSDFYLFGHSFGGYIGAHYARQFPQHVRKLLLVSPVGLRHWTAEMNAATPIVYQPTEENPSPPNFNDLKFRLGWATHTPFSNITSRLPYWLVKKGARDYLNKRIPVSDEEKEVLADFTAWFVS